MKNARPMRLKIAIPTAPSRPRPPGSPTDSVESAAEARAISLRPDHGPRRLDRHLERVDEAGLIERGLRIGERDDDLRGACCVASRPMMP